MTRSDRMLTNRYLRTGRVTLGHDFLGPRHERNPASAIIAIVIVFTGTRKDLAAIVCILDRHHQRFPKNPYLIEARSHGLCIL